MLSFEQIKELINLVSERQLEGLQIERSGFRLQIQGQRRVDASGPGHDPDPPVRVLAEPALGAAEPGLVEASSLSEPQVPEGSHVLNSPIVGTFYASPSPESDPYVRKGDRVKKGQVLCIVEAMKLMNEIESDADGEVLEIFPKNAQPVEFGEPLFAIQED